MYSFQSLSGIGYNVIMKDIMNEQQRNNMSILVSTGNNEGLYLMYSFQSLSGIGYNDNNERHNE